MSFNLAIGYAWLQVENCVAKSGSLSDVLEGLMNSKRLGKWDEYVRVELKCFENSVNFCVLVWGLEGVIDKGMD